MNHWIIVIGLVLSFLLGKVYQYLISQATGTKGLQQGEQYFNDELKNHLHCKLEVVEYLCSCGKLGYRLLRCNEASNCIDEAVGIAVQFEHDCHQ
jgi:hypothetical protein